MKDGLSRAAAKKMAREIRTGFWNNDKVTFERTENGLATYQYH